MLKSESGRSGFGCHYWENNHLAKKFWLSSKIILIILVLVLLIKTKRSLFESTEILITC